MAELQSWFDQDINKAVQVHYLDGNVFSADNAGNIIGVSVWDNGQPATLGGSVSANIIRADGVTVTQPGTLFNNKAYVALPQAAYVVPGVISVIIKLTSGNTIATLCAVVANVYQSTTDSVIDPGTIIPSVETLIAEIEAAVASIPADYSSLWAKLAPNFSSSTAYTAGQYCTYNGGFYRFRVDHSGTWVAADAVSVNIGRELTKHEKYAKSISDIIYTIGTDDENTIKLVGEIVPYRYQNGTRTDTQTSLRFRLPKQVKTVDVSMHVLNGMNSYTFLDANDNVLFYKYETSEADVNYTDLYAWEAAYLICSNNNANIDTISVTAKIKGVGLYVDEAKKTSGEVYTLLTGEPQAIYYNLLVAGEGNYSVKFNIAGYDYVDISSYNVRDLNKYTMFDANGNIIGLYMNDDNSAWGVQTSVKVAVPSNAATMYVSTYRNQRANVMVYGIKEPDTFGWQNCAGTFADYVYQADVEYEREAGSKEFAASPFDIFRLVDGTNAHANNVFTAFDSENNILGYVRFDEAGQNDIYFICPKGTVKVAIAGARVAAGLGTTATMTIQKRKTNGKKLSVMGDSISSYLNFLPEGNAAYYEWGNRGVPSASYLWWGIVAREKGYAISTINSWSGSRVSNTTSNPFPAMCMTRTENLGENGDPDIIIIYGGVNDYMNEVSLGTWAGRADIPTTGTTFRDAYAMMLNKIHANYPLAKIYCCTLANLERDLEQGSLEHRPSGEITQNTQWLHEFNEAIRQIAPIMNCTVIEVESCGINQYNMATYMGDYSSSSGGGLHPNAEGHKLFAQRILNSLI